MTAAEILQELVLLQKFFRTDLDHEPLRTRELHTTRSYDFVRLEWKDDEYNSFCIVELICNADKAQPQAVLKSVYCQDKALEDLIRRHISASFPLVKAVLPFSDTIVTHLVTADRIAALTANCASGDNYRPGNFSKVLLADEYILLSQINHMNAKSLAHKENYSLRDLEFFIPLTPTSNFKFHDDYHSGEMLIRFDDRSSKNNRMYGDRVTEELSKLKG